MKRFFYGLIALLTGVLSTSLIAHAVTISMAIPGGPSAYPTSTGPGGFVANFYQFALMIGGVLAFGVIVYGGVKYMASAGNPSGQSDAKEWIEAAVLGLLLLVGAYFILNVVNPQMTKNLNLPTLTPVTITPAATTNGDSGTPANLQSSNDNSACGYSNPNGACPTIAGVLQKCTNVPGFGYTCKSP